MLQRNSSPLRACALVLPIAVALFGVAPHHATAQVVQPAMPMPIPVPTVPAPPAPPSPLPPSAVTTVVPTVPPAPPAHPHPVGVGMSPHGNSEHEQVLINGNILDTIDGTERPSASKSLQREQQLPARKQQKSGRRQWAMSERLRVQNEAARREADRMINAASPMDRSNRYSSD